jgi:hypothetical protein
MLLPALLDEWKNAPQGAKNIAKSARLILPEKRDPVALHAHSMLNVMSALSPRALYEADLTTSAKVEQDFLVKIRKEIETLDTERDWDRRYSLNSTQFDILFDILTSFLIM